jgi:cytochrome b involved in lipid metabolism
MAEVRRHNQRNDAWLVVRGVVYDVTSFARRHPGGSSVVIEAAGTDATNTFVNNHNEQTALRGLKQYEVGVIGR